MNPADSIKKAIEMILYRCKWYGVNNTGINTNLKWSRKKNQMVKKEHMKESIFFYKTRIKKIPRNKGSLLEKAFFVVEWILHAIELLKKMCQNFIKNIFHYEAFNWWKKEQSVWMRRLMREQTSFFSVETEMICIRYIYNSFFLAYLWIEMEEELWITFDGISFFIPEKMHRK